MPFKSGNIGRKVCKFTKTSHLPIPSTNNLLVVHICKSRMCSEYKQRANTNSPKLLSPVLWEFVHSKLLLCWKIWASWRLSKGGGFPSLTPKSDQRRLQLWRSSAVQRCQPWWISLLAEAIYACNRWWGGYLLLWCCFQGLIFNTTWFR